MADNNLHKGHRNRVRQRFLEEGMEKFYDHQFLELLLFYAIPRKDTNALAHQLLNRFGSIHHVLQASPAELKECHVGENAAVFLHLIDSICSRYLQERYETDYDIDDNQLKDFISRCIFEHLSHTAEEQYLLILLNNKNQCQFHNIIHSGAIVQDDLFTQKVIRLAVSYQCDNVFLVHHLPDDAMVSLMEERDFADILKTTFRIAGIMLKDYILSTPSGSQLFLFFKDEEEEDMLEDDLDDYFDEEEDSETDEDSSAPDG